MANGGVFLALLVLGHAIHATVATSTNPKIEHVVVLMLENRSFDHLLGYLKSLNANVDGPTGNERNPYDPQDPSQGYVNVSNDATFILNGDPGHSHWSTDMQQFGFGPVVDPAPMTGFVKDYQGSDDVNGATIMKAFDPHKLVTISTLAQNFAVVDRWFSSIPGPTQVNRLYVHSATSHGFSDNPSDEKYAEGFPQRSIYDHLYHYGHEWRCYFAEAPSMVLMRDVRQPKFWKNYRPMEMFADDCEKGNLADYTWVEPRWFNWLYNFPASDEHPPHDVVYGEFLINHVYKHLRASPKWNSTLFVVMFDEHGGFYDHVSPPQTGVPAPDDYNQQGFDFTRLGIRIPLVVASPYIEPNTVVSGLPAEYMPTQTSQFDHSSIPATLKNLFDLPTFLTNRDAWANPLESLVNYRSTPRTDCPTELPVPGRHDDFAAWEKVVMEGETEENIKAGHAGEKSTLPITGLQREVLLVTAGAAASSPEERAQAIKEIDSLKTEYEGAMYAREATRKFLARLEREDAAADKL